MFLTESSDNELNPTVKGLNYYKLLKLISVIKFMKSLLEQFDTLRSSDRKLVKNELKDDFINFERTSGIVLEIVKPEVKKLCGNNNVRNGCWAIAELETDVIDEKIMDKIIQRAKVFRLKSEEFKEGLGLKKFLQKSVTLVSTRKECSKILFDEMQKQSLKEEPQDMYRSFFLEWFWRFDLRSLEEADWKNCPETISHLLHMLKLSHDIVNCETLSTIPINGRLSNQFCEN